MPLLFDFSVFLLTFIEFLVLRIRNRRRIRQRRRQMRRYRARMAFVALARHRVSEVNPFSLNHKITPSAGESIRYFFILILNWKLHISYFTNTLGLYLHVPLQLHFYLSPLEHSDRTVFVCTFVLILILEKTNTKYNHHTQKTLLAPFRT